MYVLAAGARVTQLRFLPDGRLLVGTWAAGDAELLILPLPTGPRVVIPLPVRQVWDEPNRVAVSPAGDRFYTTFGALVTRDGADGRELPDGPSGPASQVIVSPDGHHLISAFQDVNGDTVLIEFSDGERRPFPGRYPHPERKHLVGFLDDDRYSVIGDNQFRIEQWYPEPGAEPFLTRYPSLHVNQAQVSPCRRHVGVVGYSAMYIYDTATPRQKPRLIKGSSAFGNFVGFAFHPAGRTLAVIHGGPTLVKLYDLDTLTLRAKLNWKVGPLTCVAYSPDGQLAAVGTDDGRVVVWDADE